MRKCEKCGALFDNSKVICVDCGEKLPPPMSEAEEEAAEAHLDRKLDKMYDKTDPLVVNLPMKIAAVLAAVAASVNVFLIIFVRSPYTSLSIVAVFCCVIAFLDALFPQFIFALTRLRDAFTYSNYDELQPSDWYGRVRKIGVWVLVAFALISAATVIADGTEILQKNSSDEYNPGIRVQYSYDGSRTWEEWVEESE